MTKCWQLSELLRMDEDWRTVSSFFSKGADDRIRRNTQSLMGASLDLYQKGDMEREIEQKVREMMIELDRVVYGFTLTEVLYLRTK